MLEKSFIQQGINRVNLDKFLKKELYRAGYTKADIVKTSLVTRIVVNVTKPGLAIGKSGQNIRSLTNTIKEQYGIDNPQLEIKEIEKPELNAAAMADKMKSLIERGFSWRSIAYRTVKDIMAAGAQGVEIKLAGVLAGKGQRKRRARIAEGYLKKVGYQTKFVDYSNSHAYTKIGAIGVKVRIVRPDAMFTDKLDLAEYIERFKSGKQEKKAEETVEEKKEEVEGKKEEAKEVEQKETKKEVERKETAVKKEEVKEKKETPKEEKKPEVKKEEAKEKVGVKGTQKEAPKTESKQEKSLETVVTNQTIIQRPVKKE